MDSVKNEILEDCLLHLCINGIVVFFENVNETFFLLSLFLFLDGMYSQCAVITRKTSSYYQLGE